MSGITGNVTLRVANDVGSAKRCSGQYQVNIRPWVAEILSPKEMCLLQSLLDGRSLTATATAWGRSIKTLSTWKIGLYGKLGIRNDMLLYKNLLEQNAIELLEGQVSKPDAPEAGLTASRTIHQSVRS